MDVSVNPSLIYSQLIMGAIFIPLRATSKQSCAGRNYNCHIPKGFAHLFAVYGFYAWAFEKKRKDNFKEIPILLWDKEVASNESMEMGCKGPSGT